MEEEVGTDDDMHTADEEGKTPIKKVARQLNERELQQKLATLEKEIAKLGINRMREGLPLPEFYSGIEDFEAYLRRFNKIATAHQWSGTRCTQILPLYLLEEARAIYDSLGADSKNTWKGLTDALAIKLKKLNTKESARRMLTNRKQKSNESIIEFTQVIRGLINKAFPENSFKKVVLETEEARTQRIKDWRDDLAKDYFKNGIKLEIKEKLAFITTDTLEDTINQAKQIEEVQNALKEDRMRSYQNKLSEKAILEVNAVRDQVNELKEQVDRRMPTQPVRGNYNNWRGNFNTRGNWNQRNNYNREQYSNNRNNFQNYNNWRGANFNRGRGTVRWGQRRGAGSFNSNKIPINNPRNFGAGASNSARINSLAMPYITIMMLLMFCQGICGQYQICPKDKIGESIDFPSPQDCTLSLTHQMEIKNVTLFLPKLVPRYFPIYRCWMERQVKCTDAICFIGKIYQLKKKDFH
uniref:Retrotransposon gag domain-containing protein n=1 Tax=Meloidogyne incognita TaxID=6306 RepID=A0A914NSJ4_MELIC